MVFIPIVAQPLLQAFAVAFTQPTFQRWLLLLVAALLTPGRRTVSNVLRTVHSLVVGHPPVTIESSPPAAGRHGGSAAL